MYKGSIIRGTFRVKGLWFRPQPNIRNSKLESLPPNPLLNPDPSDVHNLIKHSQTARHRITAHKLVLQGSAAAYALQPPCRASLSLTSSTARCPVDTGFRVGVLGLWTFWLWSAERRVGLQGYWNLQRFTTVYNTLQKDV